jgi:predicted dehydrogenase
VHAPFLAATPALALAGVWTRRPAAAQELADRHGVPVFRHYRDLLAGCDAVCFAVPPAVQAELAEIAARAGRHVLLEAPIGWDLSGAERLAGAVAAAGVVSQVAFTWRYTGPVRGYLATLTSEPPPEHATGRVVRARPASRTESRWRRERNLLFDVGPHVVELLDAALGQVVAASADDDGPGRVVLRLQHLLGRSSETVLSAGTTIERDEAGFELTSAHGSTYVHCSAAEETADYAVLHADFAAAVRTGEPGELDVRRGLHVQRVIEAAGTDLLLEH